ncbi:hypothetical protein GCM10023215_67900 [Pseudonocardia yuanmonensis]|uniref:Uncharacterized protein n=1 Tax=Pseudonocardia yuanmonensis TaxID=1095914 RepID=A0ABP8XU86_9PSEU
MSKAGPALLRTTLVRAADHARRQDPQLARLYYTQIVERGANHTKALCVVAAALAERAWTVLRRGMPYIVCDTDNTPVDPAEARRIITERWTVPPEVRARRRSRKNTTDSQARWAGKAPQRVHTGHQQVRHPKASTNEATFPTRHPHAADDHHARREPLTRQRR